MRYLIFTNTPAHVHLYKHAAAQLRDRGHTVELLARDYGCTVDLLEWYDLPHTVYGSCGTTKSSLFARLPGHYARIVRRAVAFDPDLIFGMGSYSAHAGAVTRTPTILVLDSEPTGLDHQLSIPFADALLTPAAFRKDLGSKHYVFDGFKENAYLNPEVFSPRTDVRDRLGVAEDESFTLLRFNAFGSHHDVGKTGFTPERRRELIERLADHTTVYVSDEGGRIDLSSMPAREFDLHPALLHDALYESDLLVADTQTIVTEAALLGTPAIRSNTFVGEDDMGNFLELERHDLVYNIAEFDDVLERAVTLLDADGVGETWRARRDAFMADKVNLTELLVDLAESKSVEQTDGLSVHSTSVALV